MRKLIALTLFAYLIFIPSIFSQDTFSILAVDTLTGEIGAAGATCSDGIATVGGVQLINKIIPGKGAVNAQAWICLNENSNLDYAMDQINKNRQAEEVLDTLLSHDRCEAQDYNIDFRQYGIITIDSAGGKHLTAHTGNMTSDYKGEKKGANYIIIGNNLTEVAVLESMEYAFLQQDGTLADKLMAAMHAGKETGGDARCSDRGTSSTSAFIRVAKPDDEAEAPFLYISIPGVPMGVEPLDSLQTLYNDFLVSTSNSVNVLNGLNLLHSPEDKQLFFTLNLSNFSDFNVSIYNTLGVQLLSQKFHQHQTLYPINLPDITNGVYLFTVKTKEGFASKKFQVLR